MSTMLDLSKSRNVGAHLLRTPVAAFACLQISIISLSAFSSAGAAEPATTKAKADLPNFHEVHDYLYRGGEPSTRGLDELKDKGIKTIIDLRAWGKRTTDEKAQADKLGMKYINLPMSDKPPTEEQVATLVHTIESGRDAHEPVFVHCAHGSDRTGCMVGIWRVTHDGYSYKEAYKEMRSYFFGPQFKALAKAVETRSMPLGKGKP